MHKIHLVPANSRGIINRNIFGHFSEHLGRGIYEGLYVGENSSIPNVNGIRSDAVKLLKKIGVPVLRWPGGCFADEYHWYDGIGPKEKRTRMVNTNWGHVVEDNSFGTHEFLELCRQLECEPYITGNVGSGTVREMAEWVEYLNSAGDSTVVRQRWANGRKDPWGVKFWGVGNESWGCGGEMHPEYYANEFRRFNTYCRDYDENKLYRIACGPDNDNYNWTEVLMKNAAHHMDALSFHYYTTYWDANRSATQFGTWEYYRILKLAARIDELICGHLAIMDKYDSEHKVDLVVDEWGTWFNVEKGTNPGFMYQQNTMRDAMVAAITLNAFMAHCDRIAMANIAQMVNVVQSMLLTEGGKIVCTPTYHVFDLYKAHQDAQQMACIVESCEIGEAEFRMEQVIASASRKEGVITLTCANLSDREAAEVQINITDVATANATGHILTGRINQYNDFDNAPLSVQPFQVDNIRNGLLVATLPPCCVAEITIQNCHPDLW